LQAPTPTEIALLAPKRGSNSRSSARTGSHPSPSGRRWSAPTRLSRPCLCRSGWDLLRLLSGPEGLTPWTHRGHTCRAV